MELLTSVQLGAKKCQPCEVALNHVSCFRPGVNCNCLVLTGTARRRQEICRKLKLADFAEAIRIINAIAELAEREQHHPDLHLTGYRQVRIDLTTHSIGGISENDFILAAKIDLLLKELG